MSPVPTLAIEKKESALNGITLLEYIPLNRIRALLKSGLMTENWDPKNYTTKFCVKNGFDNETQQLTAYKEKYNKKLGGVAVQYNKAKSGWGRVYAKESLGLTAMCGKTRNTLLQGDYYDFDLSNAQPKIIQAICSAQSPPIDCPQVDEYCARRDEILAELMATYDVDRKDAKGLMLRLCFFGTFEGWQKENKLPETIKPTQFIVWFERELEFIADLTKKVNKVLYDSARHAKVEKTSKKKEAQNIIGSFYATYLQEYEVRILEAVMSHLMKETKLMDHPLGKTEYKVGAYEYDGIKLLKSNVDKFEGGRDGVLKLLNKITQELSGFAMLWEEKPIEKFYDLTEALAAIEAEPTTAEPKLAEICKKIITKFDDTGVIETISELFPKNFVYSNKEWFGWNGKKWEMNDRPLRNAITYKIPEYWRGLLEPFKTGKDDDDSPNGNLIKNVENVMEKFIKTHLRDNHNIGQCVGQGKTLLADDYLEFDDNPYLLGFNNGVLDTKERIFRPYRFDDYMTWSTGWDFTPSTVGMRYLDAEGVEHVVAEAGDLAEKEVLADLLTKIQPDPEVRKLVLLIFSTALVGLAIEKFFVFNGKGRNGKGFLHEFLKWVMGQYLEYVSPIILTENLKNKSSAQANPEIAKISKKRYIIMTEPPKNQPIQNSVIKGLSGGGELQARMLFSSKTAVKLCQTNAFECNVKPLLAEAPEQADAERIVDIGFPAFFTSDITRHGEPNTYPVDTSLKTPDWKNKHRNAFMNILIVHLFELMDKKMEIESFIPQSIKQRSMDYLQESFNIHQIFMELFVEVPADDPTYENTAISVAQLTTIVRRSHQFYQDLTKAQQKEYKAEKIKEFFLTNAFYKKYIQYNSRNKQDIMRGWTVRVEEKDVMSDTSAPCV